MLPSAYHACAGKHKGEDMHVCTLSGVFFYSSCWLDECHALPRGLDWYTLISCASSHVPSRCYYCTIASCNYAITNAKVRVGVGVRDYVYVRILTVYSHACVHMYRYMATGQVIGTWHSVAAAVAWVSQSVGFACVATPCTVGHAMALWGV